MRTVFFIFFILFLTAATGYCDQKYNPHTGEWETVPDNSDWDNRYNPHDGSWSYQPKSADVEYNPHIKGEASLSVPR